MGTGDLSSEQDVNLLIFKDLELRCQSFDCVVYIIKISLLSIYHTVWQYISPKKIPLGIVFGNLFF